MNRTKSLGFFGPPPALRVFRATLIALLWSGVLAVRADRFVVPPGTPGGTNAGTYTNWGIAATQIQWAVDAATNGETVWVTNGVYAAGGGVMPGYILTNRVIVTNAIILRSAADDPRRTIIAGAQVGGAPGAAAVRCVWASNATVIGFTLTNGGTCAEGHYMQDRAGGGILLRHQAVVSNCLILNNTAAYGGGGACLYGNGTITHSAVLDNLTSNSAGAVYLTPGSTINNCIVSGNAGGGLYFSGGGLTKNSLICSNYSSSGAGVYLYLNGALLNCTVVNNAATNHAGGVYEYQGGTVSNCIVWQNTAGLGTSNIHNNAVSNYSYTCSGPAQTGPGNIASDPQFADVNAGNWRLNANSPCLNTGTNQAWMTNAVDLDGRTRVRYGTVDMGAYEAIYEGSFFRFGF